MFASQLFYQGQDDWERDLIILRRTNRGRRRIVMLWLLRRLLLLLYLSCIWVLAWSPAEIEDSFEDSEQHEVEEPNNQLSITDYLMIRPLHPLPSFRL